jgi:hypothetical protein
MHFPAQHSGAEPRGAIMMTKTEDLPLVRIRIHGKSGEVSLIEEPEPSLEEWNHIRTTAFAQLRKAETIIPHELIDLVERFEGRTLVQIFFYKTSDGTGLRFRMEPIDKKPKRDSMHRSAEITAKHKPVQNAEKQNLLTASEALAFFLRIVLRDLKYAEKKRKAAPVRTSNLVPRSVIAEIAMGLLDSCEAAKDAPGPFLHELFRELLNVGTDKHGAPRQLVAQEEAVFAIAQHPTVHTRELARILNVNPSTVSRWRRSSEFQARVKEAAETMRRWDEMRTPANKSSG